MQRTAEVRWFLREVPGPLRDWFAAHGGEPEHRTDDYLRLPGTDALGVKVRGGGGSLELKLRTRDHGTVEVAPGVKGLVEEWQKWSVDPEQPVPGLGIAAAHWVPVGKARRVATLAMGGWAPGPPTDRAAGGCSAELTRLDAPGGPWATLGFEAFGPGDDLVGTLRRAAERFFAEPGLTAGLAATLSCGYPGWVALVAGDGPPA
jgi:hypothetical protein